MLTPQQLADAFGRNVEIVKLQTQGLSHADSLIQLPFRGNCLNWVVGHLVTNRNAVLELLDGEPALDPRRVARYARESEPITADAPAVLPLAELVNILEQSQAQLAEILAAATPELLSRQAPLFGSSTTRPLSDWLFFLYFHDCYHVGQTEILRQAAGVDDKVI
jgi:hypothetical protein